MKKLVVMPLVLSAAVLITACGAEKTEQVKNEMINKAASEKLDEVIKEKASTIAEGADAMVDKTVEGVEDVVEGAGETVKNTAKEAVDAGNDVVDVVEEVIVEDDAK